MNEPKNASRDFFPIFLMAVLFIFIQGLALLIVKPFVAAGMQAFDDVNDPLNLAYILITLLVVTGIILIIAKYWKKKILHILLLGAIGYTIFFAFFLPIYGIFLPDLPLWFYLFISALSTAILLLALIKFPEWYVIDICGIMVGASAIAILGISLGILLVIILLLCLIVYDAISVYKTKHMIDLADTVIDLKLPVLLVVPKIRHYSLIKETKSLKEKLKTGEERDAFFMGLGDVVMPGLLVASVYRFIENGLPIALSVMAGTLVGFAILMFFVIKGKPQAGLPCLAGGAILGYMISSLYYHGQLVGLNFFF
ncbi:MAG: presenilin family intramembrane aspartyl protease [Candidatus Thermoplasmatota archaeon]|jgi:presenilin-like A22 family membrane protease|nr:presenilin family intramembrane aspartyl protease [Candidatus Thermoplasmatota archaeon]